MPSLQHLRRQLDTATDLSSVVTTMKTLAAVSIHQYERAVEALVDYNRTIEWGFRIVLRNAAIRVETGSATGRTGAIIFGSDQGMCGQFNEEITSVAGQQREDGYGPPYEALLAVGVRAESQLLDDGWHVHQTYNVPTSVSEITSLVQELLLQVERLRSEASLDRLLVFHNSRTSASSFEPNVLKLLPLDSHLVEQWRAHPWPTRALPAFRADRRGLLSQLIRQYLFVSLFRACAESLASENASRIAAMQAAEKNIDEKLEELQGEFNQRRQMGITQELLDVVTGFEALATEDH